MTCVSLPRAHGTIGAPAAAFLCLAVASAGSASAAPQSAAIERVSVDSAGVEGLFDCPHVSVSGNGRLVAFDSGSQLVSGASASSFVYVRDRRSRTTELASVALGGGNAFHIHRAPRISDDGRWVVFVSNASDLGPNDANGMSDVYVYDRQSGATDLVSVSSSGAQANQPSAYPNISADGRFVVFVSGASNLVAGDVQNMYDVFLRDRLHGITERVSVSSAGVGGNNQSGSLGNRVEQAVSADGRWVTFVSWASNLVPGDTNQGADVFLRDRLAGETRCLSVAADGMPGDAPSWAPRISPDGRFIAFSSWATDLVEGDTNAAVDVFLYDRESGSLTRVSTDSSGAQLDESSGECALSADGRVVAFVSSDPRLAPGGNGQSAHVFVRDLRLGTTRIASLGADGAFENGSSIATELSADGSTLVFKSSSSNLVALDTNQAVDAFAHDLRLTPALVYCTGKPHSEGCTAAISASGVASVSSGLPFLVRAEEVVSGTWGLLVHSSAWQELPFQGGVLCLAGALARTPAQASGGTLPCGGSFSLDLNGYFRSGPGHMPGPGDAVTAQWWFRDPADPFLSGLSNALLFYLQP